MKEIKRLETDGTYTVKRGDSLWEIAKAFYGNGTASTEIARRNNIKPNNIFPGQVLKIYHAYNQLDKEQKKIASEIAKKFPCTTEYVAKVLTEKDFNQEEAENYIKQQFILAGLGI